jgi:hypothetical protein
VSIDPHFERSVLAAFRLRERRARRRDELHGARLLAQKLHRGRLDLLAHLRRVAHALPGLDGAPPSGETLAALRLLPDPWLAA